MKAARSALARALEKATARGSAAGVGGVSSGMVTPQGQLHRHGPAHRDGGLVREPNPLQRSPELSAYTGWCPSIREGPPRACRWRGKGAPRGPDAPLRDRWDPSREGPDTVRTVSQGLERIVRDLALTKGENAPVGLGTPLGLLLAHELTAVGRRNHGTRAICPGLDRRRTRSLRRRWSRSERPVRSGKFRGPGAHPRRGRQGR